MAAGALAAAGAAKAFAPKNENVKTFITVSIFLVVIVVVIMILSRTFGGIDKLLEKLGIQKSKEEKENEADVKEGATNAAAPGSPWSPAFYKTAPGGALLLTVATADKLAKQIWDSVGVFYDDSDQAYGAIKQCYTQSQISFLADRFNLNYKRDLFDWMENKFDTKEQEETLAKIVAYVNKLPKYFK